MKEKAMVSSTELKRLWRHLDSLYGLGGIEHDIKRHRDAINDTNYPVGECASFCRRCASIGEVSCNHYLELFNAEVFHYEMLQTIHEEMRSIIHALEIPDSDR